MFVDLQAQKIKVRSFRKLKLSVCKTAICLLLRKSKTQFLPRGRIARRRIENCKTPNHSSSWKFSRPTKKLDIGTISGYCRYYAHVKRGISPNRFRWYKEGTSDLPEYSEAAVSRCSPGKHVLCMVMDPFFRKIRVSAAPLRIDFLPRYSYPDRSKKAFSVKRADYR